jgi:hypothetical protein
VDVAEVEADCDPIWKAACVNAETGTRDLADAADTVGHRATSWSAVHYSTSARAITCCRIFAKAHDQYHGPNEYEIQSHGADHVDHGHGKGLLIQLGLWVVGGWDARSVSGDWSMTWLRCGVESAHSDRAHPSAALCG